MKTHMDQCWPNGLGCTWGPMDLTSEPILGTGMRRSTFQKKRFFSEKGGRISVNEGLGKDSTGMAIQ